ncbi:hypothetical protein CMU84_17720 [Elizabethkingia anophelis]|nr:hypothetical protein [Elizabethkingia anophelis]MDV3710154.1 hypothetical protein [Elizabethkingia anophelis]MDV3733629.1 hypothetical protein [Elizabethkingia anophelis]
MKYIYILPIAGLFFLNSCRSTDTENNLQDSKLSGVSFSIGVSDFEGGDDLAEQASLKSNISNKPEVLKQELASGPFNITAELSQDTPSSKLQTQTSIGSRVMAATSPLSLRGAVRYRIAAYTQDGKYIDQAVGIANQPNQIFFGDKLIKGQTYNFIIYSLGSTTVDPPAVPTDYLFQGASDRLFVIPITSFTENAADLMWVKESNVKILGTPGDTTAPTPLTTPLKHIFTRINVVIDNSDDPDGTGPGKGGYLSENTVNATITSPDLRSSAWLSMNSGTIMSNASSAPSISANDLKATAQTYLVMPRFGNTPTTVSISVPAGAIKVGNDTNPNPATFSFSNAGAGLKPGYSYTLKLRFNSDRYVNASNVTRNATDSDALYAVIGGYRWDRYNLGINNLNPATNNPDIIANLPNLNGNFYQWGRISGFDPSTPGFGKNGNFIGWNPNETGVPTNSWNMGSESTPIKNKTNDPCSGGGRIPTKSEWGVLLNRTNASNIGTWADGSDTDVILRDYTSSGKVLASKKSTNIKLTFPMSGNRGLPNGHLNQRSNRGEYWTSFPQSLGSGWMIYIDETGIKNTYYSIVQGNSIRCIQDK